MMPPTPRSSCTSIEDSVLLGSDANLFVAYEHPVYEVPATKSFLEMAVEQGCARTVKLLIEKGATLEDEPIEDFYLDGPVTNCRERLLRLNIHDEEKVDGNGALFLWSLFFRNIEVSEVLFDQFVASQSQEDKDRILLAGMMLSAELGDLEVMQFVMEKGGCPFINAQENSYVTPFHQSCIYGWTRLVEMLLHQGADLNLENADGDFPLISAIHNGNEEVALLLLNAGADVKPNRRSHPLSLSKRRKLKRVAEARGGANVSRI